MLLTINSKYLLGWAYGWYLGNNCTAGYDIYVNAFIFFTFCFYFFSFFGWADKLNIGFSDGLKGSEKLWPARNTSNSAVSFTHSIHILHHRCTTVNWRRNTLISLVACTMDELALTCRLLLVLHSLFRNAIFKSSSPVVLFCVFSTCCPQLKFQIAKINLVCNVDFYSTLSLSFSACMTTLPLWLPTDLLAEDCTKTDFHTRSGSPPQLNASKAKTGILKIPRLRVQLKNIPLCVTLYMKLPSSQWDAPHISPQRKQLAGRQPRAPSQQLGKCS